VTSANTTIPALHDLWRAGPLELVNNLHIRLRETRTDLPNLTLLCGRHHRLIHHSTWKIHMPPNGKPHFIPPDYLDPHRNPGETPCTTTQTPRSR
jgi:hypothetical protein